MLAETSVFPSPGTVLVTTTVFEPASAEAKSTFVRMLRNARLLRCDVPESAEQKGRLRPKQFATREEADAVLGEAIPAPATGDWRADLAGRPGSGRDAAP